jgi:peptide/nickel transport system substrate-binding protein
MIRQQRIGTPSGFFTQASGLTLALLCSLLVACAPPPRQTLPTLPRTQGAAAETQGGVPERRTEYPSTLTSPRPAPTIEVTPTPRGAVVSNVPLGTLETVVGTPGAVPSVVTSPTAEVGQGPPGELHVALRESINSLNPYLVTTASESFVVSCLYDTLADEDAQGRLVPNLAERWELSGDGTRLTCWLNPQARWHTGQPVTANDVVFSFNLIRQADFPGLTPVAALVGQVEALGPAEVQFTLLKPGSESVRRVCSQVRIVPAALWQSVQDPLTYANLDSPVGSGPFALSEQTENGGLVLRNTGMHHSTRPSIDTLVAEIVRDESQALQALQEGKFDLLGWDVTPALARDVQDHPESYPEIGVATQAGLSVQSLLFDLRQAPYDNPVLRSALAQAIDTQTIVDQVLLGFADPGTAGLFAPASPWYDGGLAAVPFDAQQAIDKLNLAGFVDRDGDGLRENPDGTALQIPITCVKSDASLKVVQSVIAAWKAVGIRAKALALPADQIRSVLMQAKFDVILRDLTLREPEEAFFHFHSSRGLLVDGQVVGYNYGGYANADYDRAAEAMLEEKDPEKYLQLLRTLQGILTADLPQIPLYSPYVVQLYRDSRFSGWRSEPGVGLLGRTAIANLTAQ